MSVTKEDIALNYPLPVYSYRVAINGTTIAFSEVSGLTVDYEHKVYRHGLSYEGGYNLVRGRMKPATISMKRGIFQSRSGLATLIQEEPENWWEKFLSSKTEYDILIDLCDESAVPLIRWKVFKAMLLKLDGPTFSADSNDVAIENVDFISYDLQIEYVS